MFDQQERKSKYKRQISTLKSQIAITRFEKCEICGCDVLSILHVHHIIAKAAGGSDDPENLLLLCPNCHAEQHLGNMTFQEFCRGGGDAT